ncbi:MAG: Omp28-related outer membrane protein [Bacteroidia bacterium]
MKKILPVFAFALFSSVSAFAQSVTGVSMVAENKTVIVEEFTGVRCTYCPDGKIILDGLLAQYPTTMHAISFHPMNSGLTAPYGGDPDLRRTYADNFYATPYCGTSRFMPSRRVWAGERLQGRGNWGSRVSEIMAEASPLNVGILANYDSTSMTLSVTVETYYTSAVTDQNALYVQLSEDDIVVQQQSGATGAFTQDLVFRQELAATTWGDDLGPQTAGSMVTKTYSWVNTNGYNMHNAKVIAYVESKTTQELFSGKQVQVQFATATAVDPEKAGVTMNILPNPFQTQALLSYHLPEAHAVSYTITTVTGQTVATENLGDQAAGTHNVTLDATHHHLSAGVYLLQLQAGEQRLVRRMVIQ